MKCVREGCCFKLGVQEKPFGRKSESHERKMQRSGERHSKQKEEHMRRFGIFAKWQESQAPISCRPL